MNYPQNQRAGRQAELKVESAFTDWSWTVGQDHIDTGYDFFVEPDVAAFRGHRFLVQVKATTRSKRGFVARVDKERLRQYAVNPLPVFLIWSSPDGTLHWLHIQPWISRNMGRLAGSGEAGVRMLVEQLLSDRASFETYLKKIFRPTSESSDALPALAKKRSAYLSSIDHRLGVRVGLNDGKECYEIYAKSEKVEVGVELKLTDTEENKRSFIEAMQYGVPASVDVDLFRMKSEVFTAIGLGGGKGTLSIRPVSEESVTATLYPGPEYSMLASAYPIRARLYRGQGGFAVTNEGRDDIIDFQLRGEGSARGSVNVTMSFRSDVLSSAPIQNLDALGALGAWAGEAMEKNGVYLDLVCDQGRVPMRTGGEAVSLLHPVLHYAVVMGRLQKVTKALNSPLVIDHDFVLSDEEISDIDLAFRLLKGDRVNVNLGPLVFDTEAPLSMERSGDFFAQTAMELKLCNRHVGVIPVEIDLKDYLLEEVSDQTLKYRLVKREGGGACLHYRQGGRTDALLTRNTKVLSVHRG